MLFFISEVIDKKKNNNKKYKNMAVFYKFKSATVYDSIPVDDSFITLGTLKSKIFDSKKMWRGTDYDLVVANAQTNEGIRCVASLLSFSQISG